jgi:hypothetical protein
VDIDAGGVEVLVDVRRRAAAGGQHHRRVLGEEPGERELRRRDAQLARQAADRGRSGRRSGSCR